MNTNTRDRKPASAEHQTADPIRPVSRRKEPVKSLRPQAGLQLAIAGPQPAIDVQRERDERGVLTVHVGAKPTGFPPGADGNGAGLRFRWENSFARLVCAVPGLDLQASDQHDIDDFVVAWSLDIFRWTQCGLRT
jgi:hypothetical protein